MDIQTILFLSIFIFTVAALFSLVGFGGAPGYLAAMALFGIAPMEMKPVALMLNIFVVSIAAVKYIRAGSFSWDLFWPFAVTAVPFAFVGGLVNLPAIYYQPLIGFFLIFAAYYFLKDKNSTDYTVKPPVTPVLLTSGAGLGFFSGLVGLGGGIFLSPLLIFFKWEKVKNVSGIAAAFILITSLAGMMGFMSSNTMNLPAGLPYWIIAALIGGYIGAEYGSKRIGSQLIKRVLSGVVLVAGVKMLTTVA